MWMTPRARTKLCSTRTKGDFARLRQRSQWGSRNLPAKLVEGGTDLTSVCNTSMAQPSLPYTGLEFAIATRTTPFCRSVASRLHHLTAQLYDCRNTRGNGLCRPNGKVIPLSDFCTEFAGSKFHTIYRTATRLLRQLRRVDITLDPRSCR